MASFSSSPLSSNPDDYEAEKGSVIYSTGLKGQLFLWEEKVVQVARLNGGNQQVTVVDPPTNKVLGYPSVMSLVKIKPKRKQETKPNSPYKPKSPRWQSSSSETSSEESMAKIIDEIKEENRILSDTVAELKAQVESLRLSLSKESREG